MSKVALVFSGQGSQYVGMGEDLFAEFECVRDVFKLASSVLNKDVSEICFKGPEENLSKTENTQTAILTHSIACLHVLQQKNIKFDAVCGFSLGEYSALVASNVVDFSTMLKVVEQRAALMQQAVDKVDSKMSAVIGSNYSEVKDKVGSLCEISNYNSSSQIVIAGLSENVDKAKLLFDEEVKFVDLKVSGAFHTSVLDDAAEEFIEILKQVELKRADVTVMSNYTGEAYKEITAEILGKQMNHTVRFYENIKNLIAQGFDTFVELGPGKVTSSFVKQIARELGEKISVVNIEDIKSLDRTLKKLEV